MVIIKVTDKGIGICSEDLKNLFKPYFRSVDPQNLEINRYGRGLGLSICHNVA
jgi:signal transduction histidine kinase